MIKTGGIISGIVDMKLVSLMEEFHLLLSLIFVEATGISEFTQVLPDTHKVKRHFVK